MIGAGVRDSCRNSESKGETPQAQMRQGRTACGKRVPYVPINVQFVQAKKIRQTRWSLSTF
ncbi:hypothetical protein RCO48_34515 [Peribacillus frigoritolerans]|nr:hypothetical protein [Peribacillus frigoritolerans]